MEGCSRVQQLFTWIIINKALFPLIFLFDNRALLYPVFSLRLSMLSVKIKDSNAIYSMRLRNYLENGERGGYCIERNDDHLPK